MATLDDVVTVQKNGVIALNNVNQTLANLIKNRAGVYRSLTVTSRTQVASGKGILIAYTVVVTGTTAGLIYDSITPPTTSLSTASGTATVGFVPPYTIAVGDTIIVSGTTSTGSSYNTTGSTVTAVQANSVSYTSAGSGTQTVAGIVFDPNPANVIVATTATQVVGTVSVAAPFTTGLVIVPGTGQSINVIYSTF